MTDRHDVICRVSLSEEVPVVVSGMRSFLIDDVRQPRRRQPHRLQQQTPQTLPLRRLHEYLRTTVNIHDGTVTCDQ